jgi:hypothetical protein
LWHIGNDFLIVPPDYACETYGCRRGVRNRVFETIKRKEGWKWDKDCGKLAGFDFNVWNSAELTPDEVLATLKYTLDLRLAGNRAPFLFGAHVEFDPATEPGKRAALEGFVDYALSKAAVRIVPSLRIIEWMRNPRPLAPSWSV